jgi:SagB-type dehydrogenase family enzyme
MLDDIGPDFMRFTKPSHLGQSAQQLGRPRPPLELPCPPDAPIIDLPDPRDVKIDEISLRDAINNRRSVRRYSDCPLSLAELSFLLWCSQGVKEINSQPVTFRTVPSAGARHAFETYLLLNRVEGIQPGLYRFLATRHALVQVKITPSIATELTYACFNQRTVFYCAAAFFWTAVTERMIWRYGQRGYRYLHLDAGHVCQNLYLAAEAVDCGVCAIAAFDDDMLNSALDIDGQAVFAIYVATVGKRSTSHPPLPGGKGQEKGQIA